VRQEDVTLRPDRVTLRLAEKEHLLDDVWAFRFTPSEPLEWVAGQCISVELPHENPDGEGTRRWFTISSAPYEKIVQITTRITRTTFKQALSKMEVGGGLQLLGGPYGGLAWQNVDMPIVFIAGGIGITPFRSILRQRAHDRLPLNVTLIYASRTPDLLFRDEIRDWSNVDDRFTVEYVIGSPLTFESLTKLVPGLTQSLIYISGPQALLVALSSSLEAHGLPEERIKQDFFPAYTINNY
jgi:ferredoxin-NADP reductase